MLFVVLVKAGRCGDTRGVPWVGRETLDVEAALPSVAPQPEEALLLLLRPGRLLLPLRLNPLVTLLAEFLMLCELPLGFGGVGGAPAQGSESGGSPAASTSQGGADGELRARVEALQGELEALRARVTPTPARKRGKRKSAAR